MKPVRAIAVPRPAGEQMSRFFNLSLDLLCVAGFDGYFESLNPAWEKVLGFTREELLAKPYLDFVHPDDREATVAELAGLQSGSRTLCFENRYCHKDGSYRWLSWTAVPFAEERVVYAAARDITERKHQEELQGGEKCVLEMLSTGADLSDVLECLTQTIEQQWKGMTCSILLLDPDGIHLRHGAGGRLPEAYNRAIDGVAIGPNVGSCGTAAYLRKTIIVRDVAVDPLWADFRELALIHGLRACWLTPIFSSKGSVLGTFAMYYREPRSPGENDLKLIERATHLAGIAMEQKRAREELYRAHDELEARVQARTAELARANAALQAEIAERKRAEEEVKNQQEAIRKLSTPVLQVRQRLLILPVIGEIDSLRARQLTDQLLASIRANRAKVVVIDMTGVGSIDNKVADHLMKTVQAARLLGASVIVTGLSREITQTLVAIGVEFQGLTTLGDLQSGIEEAEHMLGYQVLAIHPRKQAA